MSQDDFGSLIKPRYAVSPAGYFGARGVVLSRVGDDEGSVLHWRHRARLDPTSLPGRWNGYTRDGKCLPSLGWEILAWNGILSTSTWILRIKESTSCKTANRYYEGTRIRGRHPGLARFSLPFRPFSPTPPSSPSFRLLPLSRALHDRGWEASRTRGRGRGE